MSNGPYMAYQMQASEETGMAGLLTVQADVLIMCCAEQSGGAPLAGSHRR